MNMDVLVGLIGLGIAAVTLALRVAAPAKLRKLGPMQEKLGPGVGGALHFIAYTATPAALGAMTLWRALLAA